jgi:hypothetical protein
MKKKRVFQKPKRVRVVPTETTPNPYYAVDRLAVIIHRQLTQDAIDRIGHAIEADRRTGANTEERDEWRKTWERHVAKKPR